LKGLRPKYEEHHKAEFTDKAVEASVKLSDRYITDRFLPDKAIDVLDEAGSRFNGRGVARYVAPERFRLDLFGPRGESVMAGALVGERARVPASVTERFRLPSPALLWAAVGVVRPPSAARLASATDEGGRVTVRYDLGAEGTLEYRARGGRLESLRRLKGSAVQESVELDRGAGGALRSARYRDWPALRNLNLTLESSTDEASFSDDVWSPPGTGR